MISAWAWDAVNPERMEDCTAASARKQARGAVSFRLRDGSQDNGVPVDEAVERIVDVIASRA